MMGREWACRVLWMLVAGCSQAPVQSADPAEIVKPVDWSRFKTCDALKARDKDLVQAGELTLHSLRYNVGWIPSAIEKIRSNPAMSGRAAHGVIRPACKVVYGIALALKTGLFDRKVVGVSEAEALESARALLKEVVAAHERRRSWDGWRRRTR